VSQTAIHLAGILRLMIPGKPTGIIRETDLGADMPHWP
jgi:hypothetical protein